MKVPENPMNKTFMAQGNDASFLRFKHRIAALQALKGRQSYWMKPEDAAKAGKMFDIMPHPDIDIDNLTS
jgi:hypothetical protein